MVKNENIRQHVGSMIASRRIELGYTIRELAERCGVSYQNITKIEHGRYNVSIDILKKITDALGVEIVISTVK